MSPRQRQSDTSHIGSGQRKGITPGAELVWVDGENAGRHDRHPIRRGGWLVGAVGGRSDGTRWVREGWHESLVDLLSEPVSCCSLARQHHQ